MNNIIIAEDELNQFGNYKNTSEKAELLFLQQKKNWQFLSDNYNQLNSVEIKSFHIDDLEVKAQFNPKRIISTSAKVDSKSIKERPCFLCLENLPEVQKGFKINDNYLVLCNPYPIFKNHLTIPHKDHVPQQIFDRISDLLLISKELKDKFFVFYNGPKCGASAPDHLHFQAAIKNSTPLESYYKQIINESEILLSNDILKVVLISKSIYKFIYLKSSSIDEINKYFKKIYKALESKVNSNNEPMLNIISLYENNEWNLFIFPRKKHRPNQYFFEGKNRLLISPASVDMMGLLIVPRQEDFIKLDSKIIKDIYSQVLINNYGLSGSKR